jgi:hypothetical protein
MLRRNRMKLVDIRPIKTRALSFPEPVKTLVLSEPDSIPFMDFIIKLGEWERILKIKGGK